MSDGPSLGALTAGARAPWGCYVRAGQQDLEHQADNGNDAPHPFGDGTPEPFGRAQSEVVA
ncbi:hypothetical protein [Streptomyces sp. x-80]|jgi:hypothetical protein|uniref:hypothetical protein n=1 Tax=Streptomyces sp. x-80 TaxID=2789282 RepID=UPI00397FDFC0